MPKGEIYNRVQMGNWIREIRKKSGLNSDLFAAKCVHFKDVKGKLETSPYKRVAVSYWENGKHLPSYPETLVSLAGMDYDLDHGDHGDSRERLQYVTEQMFRYLGRGLYCKNFTDLLVIFAARGVITLFEVPDIYNELMDILIKGEDPEPGLKSKLPFSTDTNVLYKQLLELETVEELRNEVRVNHSLYSIGYKVVGMRLQKLYERRFKDLEVNGGLDYNAAVRFFAPVYKDSVKKLSNYEVLVSRRFLIDLCLKLHFDRKGINETLRNAQYAELLNETDSPESLVDDLDGCRMGTAPWYTQVEETMIQQFGASPDSLPLIIEESDFPGVMFYRLGELEPKERLIYLMGVGMYLMKEGADGTRPVPLYLFDYCLAKNEMRKLLARLSSGTFAGKAERDALIAVYQKKEPDPASALAEIAALLTKLLSDFVNRIDHPARYSQGEILQECSMDLQDEYQSYYGNLSRKLSVIRERCDKKTLDKYMEDIEELHYFAAVSYTALTGFLYKGQMSASERAFFTEQEGYEKPIMNLMRFLWKMVLGDGPLYPGEHGGVLIAEEDQREINLIRILLEMTVVFE